MNKINGNIKTEEKIKGELQMTPRTIKAESLVGVHTHTHTHTISLTIVNNNINITKGNIGLSGKYYDTG